MMGFMKRFFYIVVVVLFCGLNFAMGQSGGAVHEPSQLPADWAAVWQNPPTEMRPLQIVHGVPAGVRVFFSLLVQFGNRGRGTPRFRDLQKPTACVGGEDDHSVTVPGPPAGRANVADGYWNTSCCFDTLQFPLCGITNESRVRRPKRLTSILGASQFPRFQRVKLLHKEKCPSGGISACISERLSVRRKNGRTCIIAVEVKKDVLRGDN